MEALPISQYFSLVARGAWIDVGSSVSLILGVVSSQNYIQALLCAKTLNISRAGAVTSAVVAPIIGISGVFVGMYMKINYAGIVPGFALPKFVLDKLPPIASGVVLAIILVALVGTGAGTSLGISTMLANDIFKVYIKPGANDKNLLYVNRLVIVGILVFAGVLANYYSGSLIFSWSFLSAGLRGVVAFVPLCAALFWPGRASPVTAIASMIVGLFLVLVAGIYFDGRRFDPVVLGVLGSALTFVWGCFSRGWKTPAAQAGRAAHTVKK